MTSVKPNVNPDGMYQMREAAEALGIAQSTLHRYTQRGICKASVRRCNGRRIWKGSELLKVWYYIY